MQSTPDSGASASVAERYRSRHLFSILVVVFTVLLLGWGAFVTSIDAGLAVPDWPTSLGSTNMLNPVEGWWSVIPFRAEHGHRVLATLVGMLTMALVGWTLVGDDRKWMRYLATAALGLIIFQGILGGLRVVWISLDLAVFHACMAQIFFSALVAMTLFTSRAWLTLDVLRSSDPAASRLRGFAVFTAAAVYLQIIFGALLRHPGTGIDFFLATTHATWAFVVSALVILTAYQVRRYFKSHRLLMSISRITVVLLFVQFCLGFTAFVVNLDEAGYTLPSTLQVVTNTLHMVTGALLMASVFCQMLVVLKGVELARREAKIGVSSSKSQQSLSRPDSVATA